MPESTPPAIAHALENIRVLVTRPRHQAQNLVRLIEREGGQAIRLPAVEILEPKDNTALRTAIERLDTFDLAIFVSPNAVARGMPSIKRRWAHLPAHLRLACVGHGSAKELQRFGYAAPLVPQGRFNSEALLEMPEFQQVKGKKIIIFRGHGGRELLGQVLAERGAQMEYAECYWRVKPNTDITPLLRQWAHGDIHVVTVTSVEGLQNLFDIVGESGQPWLIKTPIVVASTRIAQACRELGFKTAPLVADEASDEGFVRCIKAWRTHHNSL